MEKTLSPDDAIESSIDKTINDQLLKNKNEAVSEKEIPQMKSGLSAELQNLSDGDSCDDLDDLDGLLSTTK